MKYEDIKLLYQLYKEEPDFLRPIGEQMKRFINEEGKKLLKLVGLTNSSGKELGIKEILQESGIISKLLKMLDEFTHVVQDCFEGNTSFEIQRSQGFESFVNFEIGKYTLAEILATYTDNILRKNGFKEPQNIFEAHLEKIVKLFSHLTDKDIFI